MSTWKERRIRRGQSLAISASKNKKRRLRIIGNRARTVSPIPDPTVSDRKAEQRKLMGERVNSIHRRHCVERGTASRGVPTCFTAFEQQTPAPGREVETESAMQVHIPLHWSGRSNSWCSGAMLSQCFLLASG